MSVGELILCLVLIIIFCFQSGDQRGAQQTGEEQVCHANVTLSGAVAEITFYTVKTFCSETCDPRM